jgi:hypothetical protein
MEKVGGALDYHVPSQNFRREFIKAKETPNFYHLESEQELAQGIIAKRVRDIFSILSLNCDHETAGKIVTCFPTLQ